MPKSPGRLLPLILLSACGGGSGLPVETNPEENLRKEGSFEGLANAALLITIDGFNLGDSAYSKNQERLLGQSSCKPTQEQEQKTRADQWVNDANALWTARSLVSIDRNYQNFWYQGSTALTCGQKLLDFQRLGLASFKLQSLLIESKRRILEMTPKQGTLSKRTEDMTLSSTGTRNLEFNGLSQGQKTGTLSATLRSTVDYSLDYKDPDGNASVSNFKTVDSSRLDFMVEVDFSSGLWLNYKIPYNRLVFDLGSANSMALELRNMIWTAEGGCFPQSGQITITRTIAGQEPESFTGTVDPKQDLKVRSQLTGATLMLNPFACVLREH